jgi:hypothetical protein
MHAIARQVIVIVKCTVTAIPIDEALVKITSDPEWICSSAREWRMRPDDIRSVELTRQLPNRPEERCARVRYTPVATKFRIAAK